MKKIVNCFIKLMITSIFITGCSQTTSWDDIYITHDGGYMTRREAITHLNYVNLEPKDIIVVRDEEGKIISIENPAEYPHTHK